MPGRQAVVARHARVRLRGQDERGHAVDELFTGLPARIMQHETDRLNGIRYGVSRDQCWTAAFGLALALVWLYVETAWLFTLFPGEDLY